MYKLEQDFTIYRWDDFDQLVHDLVMGINTIPGMCATFTCKTKWLKKHCQVRVVGPEEKVREAGNQIRKFIKEEYPDA